MRHKIILKSVTTVIFFALLINNSFSQEKQGSGILSNLAEGLSINGYIDTYISWDNDKQASIRQFSSVSPYRDEFRINLAQISAKYEADRIRGIATIHFGDIPAVNWPSDQQYIQEANVGFRVVKSFWIDGGYFLTHIGGEDFLPIDNFFTSLALSTYYEPFYQSGVRFSYSFSDRCSAQLYIVNGFNVYTDNNGNKSFGIQFWVKPGKVFDITYNNLIGNEMPSGVEGRTRYYNNLVVKMFPAKKIDVIASGDFCIQEKSKLGDPNSSANMLSGFISVRYRALKNFSMALRGDYINDESGILTGVIPVGNVGLSGLKANGVTFAVEYNPMENSYVRLESKLMNTDKDQKIFKDDRNSKVEVNLSAGVGF
jgi:hypothetical protein